MKRKLLYNKVKEVIKNMKIKNFKRTYKSIFNQKGKNNYENIIS